MILKNHFVVPGLEDISSDEDIDDDIICFRRQGRQSEEIDDVIHLDNSMSESDSDVEFLDSKRRKTNKVWRNIVECDLLDGEINKIGLKQFLTNTDAESYGFSGKRKRRTSVVCPTLSKRLRDRLQMDTVVLSSSEDEIEVLCKEDSLFIVNRDVESYELPSKRRNKYKRQVIRPLSKRMRDRLQMDKRVSSSSEDEIEIIYEEDLCLKQEKKHKPTRPNESEYDQIIEEVVSDSDDETRLDSWNKLINHLRKDQYQIDFESGRHNAALRIAAQLKEPKTELIERCLLYLGLEQCNIFLEATKDIELNGGMLTKDGSRRRTSGGVFLTLIKADRSIDSAVKEQIFIENDDNSAVEAHLWWKSIEMLQLDNRNDGRRQQHRASNYGRRKEFRSYTLVDMDFFESIKDFRYRYIPIASTTATNHNIPVPVTVPVQPEPREPELPLQLSQRQTQQQVPPPRRKIDNHSDNDDDINTTGSSSLENVADYEDDSSWDEPPLVIDRHFGIDELTWC